MDALLPAQPHFVHSTHCLVLFARIQLVGIMEELLEVTASPDAPVELEAISAKLTYMGKIKAEYGASASPA